MKILKNKEKFHNSTVLSALSAAFPHTLPIMAGFLFLGSTYGIFMNLSGFPFWYPFLISIVVFAGSMQFVAVNLLLGAFDPLQAIIVTLMINARHLLYGFSLIDKYKGTGVKKAYLIFGLCDETYSVNCSLDAPHGVDSGWFFFFVTFLNQVYWVLGSLIGGLFGTIINVDIKGIEFVMTAMFVVILLEQILKGAKNIPSVLIGLTVSVVSLLIFGSDNFIIFSMLGIATILTVCRRPIESYQAKTDKSLIEKEGDL